jgi:hypothetical protein
MTGTHTLRFLPVHRTYSHASRYHVGMRRDAAREDRWRFVRLVPIAEVAMSGKIQAFFKASVSRNLRGIAAAA